jgi:hypothetical protein
MKKLLLILFCLPLLFTTCKKEDEGLNDITPNTTNTPLSTDGEQTYVPDDNFEQALINLGYDNILDDYVTTANINTITSLSLCSLNIISLTGIEDFTALDWLDCSANQITSLDISNNVALEYLKCVSNQLTSLDLTNNIALLHLQAGYNSIPSLNLSQNILLEVLAMSTCAATCPSTLTQLDVTSNTELIVLSLTQHNISTLDLSNCNKIQNLGLSGNPLGNLDLTNFPQLLDLVVIGCQLTVLNTSNNPLLSRILCASNQLTSLDVSNNTALTSLWCQDNQLTSLDLRNGNNMNFTSTYPADPSLAPALNTSNNPNLTCINVDDASYCNTDWLNSLGFIIDSQQYFSSGCN